MKPDCKPYKIYKIKLQELPSIVAMMYPPQVLIKKLHWPTVTDKIRSEAVPLTFTALSVLAAGSLQEKSCPLYQHESAQRHRRCPCSKVEVMGRKLYLFKMQRLAINCRLMSNKHPISHFKSMLKSNLPLRAELY